MLEVAHAVERLLLETNAGRASCVVVLKLASMRTSKPTDVQAKPSDVGRTFQFVLAVVPESNRRYTVLYMLTLSILAMESSTVRRLGGAHLRMIELAQAKLTVVSS
jgi:hypothetical protein